MVNTSFLLRNDSTCALFVKKINQIEYDMRGKYNEYYFAHENNYDLIQQGYYWNPLKSNMTVEKRVVHSMSLSASYVELPFPLAQRAPVHHQVSETGKKISKVTNNKLAGFNIEGSIFALRDESLAMEQSNFQIVYEGRLVFKQSEMFKDNFKSLKYFLIENDTDTSSDENILNLYQEIKKAVTGTLSNLIEVISIEGEYVIDWSSLIVSDLLPATTKDWVLAKKPLFFKIVLVNENSNSEIDGYKVFKINIADKITISK